MTRRDHSEERTVAAGNDGPDLPSGWAVRKESDDELVVAHEGGDLALSVTRERGIWKIRGHQRSGEARHVTDIGAVSTRDDAMRRVLSCMEQVNAELERVGWDRRICLPEVVDGVCTRDAATMEHIVQ
ncbi:hypothetical protein [Halostella pelagica]|uniref:hypothetical protein n=1 Tax=Halostella pelagica TaxID=2583824 RepID=UPI001080F1CE|nr:hypothetical protein [Halostella pelagica]